MQSSARVRVYNHARRFLKMCWVCYNFILVWFPGCPLFERQLCIEKSRWECESCPLSGITIAILGKPDPKVKSSCLVNVFLSHITVIESFLQSDCGVARPVIMHDQLCHVKLAFVKSYIAF